MDPDATLPPPDAALRDFPTVGYDNGEPPRVPPAATGLADDGDAPEVPGYEVQRELGRGGMGVVYLARQVSLNRSVALKLLPGDRHLGPLVRQRFQAEAESAAKVSHPGIVQVYEIGAVAGRPYFALEFCPGGSLTAKLNGTPLPPRQAAELVEGVARAVQAAHDAGVIHRDLKPDNVLFAADRTPKVADFGLAKPVHTDSSLTTDGAILGTPSYMAPEQARGDGKAVGPAADGYALGAVLYECLTGRPPFRAATLMETLAQVTAAEPVAPRRLLPGLPKDLETICLKCLAKEPGKRYPSASALADDLRRFLDGRPIQARPVSLPERAWKTLRRRPEIGVVAGVVVAALGTVFWVMYSSNLGLRHERTRLEEARRQADANYLDAVQQRAKADDRLAAAVDAVESMIGHTAAENWSTTPMLQEERRKLLEDAVAFYERLAKSDGDDPVVMRESAKAYQRAGKAWLGLGENPKALHAFRSAVGLTNRLLTDKPDDPDRAKAAAEANAYMGHALAVAGSYEAALNEYRRAVELAERAVAGDPTDADAALTLVRARNSLANYYMVSDPSRSLTEATTAADLAAKLAAPADAPAAHRLVLAESLLQVGSAHLTAGRQAEAGKAYEQADEVFARLNPTAKPSRKGTGEFHENMMRVRGQIEVQRGAVRLGTARGPADLQAALKLLNGGLKTFDVLLKAQPKSFPYQVSKYQALGAVALASERLKDTAARDRATADQERLGAEILAASPSATWVLAAGTVRRTNRLIQAVRDGEFDDFADTAAELLKLSGKMPLNVVGPVVKYNVACGYAQMALLGPEGERDGHAAVAVELLAELADVGYFKRPSAAKDLAGDKDLDPLRGRDDFKAVQAKIADTGPKR